MFQLAGAASLRGGEDDSAILGACSPERYQINPAPAKATKRTPKG